VYRWSAGALSLYNSAGMSRVTIAGAGPIGAGVVHLLARRGRLGEIVVIDEQAAASSGKSLDILQSGPIEGFDTRVVATPDAARSAGSAVIVVADHLGGAEGEWLGEPALAIVNRLAAASPRAFVVCAGAGQAWVIERVAAELTVPASRVVGSAPLALEAAFRSLVALEVDASAIDVHTPVGGQPPGRVTVDWERARIGEAAALDRLPLSTLRRLERLLPRLWPPGPFALASAAAAVAAACCTSSRRAHRCFAVTRSREGLEVGVREVRFGPHGLEPERHAR
jgi:malate/lactate dehydrogenase